MPSEFARQLSLCERGLVVAPAGCGKTHLIAEAVGCSEERQLVLTHTHAGVRAMLNHLRQLGVPSNRYRVRTIDGWALKLASAFPTLSRWDNLQPTGDAWRKLRPAAARTLEYSTIRRVVAASYKGVYIDEYQDCTAGQHSFITAIARILPSRVLGDPLQAIFRKIDREDCLDWREVESAFPLVKELSTPYRWINQNDELGRWLLRVRQKLIAGEPIDLRHVATINWTAAVEVADQIRACYGSAQQLNDSTLAVRAFRPQCYKLARNLKGSFDSMESVECSDLLTWCERFQSSQVSDRPRVVVEFSKACIAGLPPAVKKLAKDIGSGKSVRPRREDFCHLASHLKKLVQTDDLKIIEQTMATIEKIEANLVHSRRELWNEMRRAIRNHDPGSGRTLRETAWQIRDQARRIGRRVPRRCLSTTLLVKGLEFDHAVILNAADFEDAENLYVAMTRGSKSLTILSETPILKRPQPSFAKNVRAL